MSSTNVVKITNTSFALEMAQRLFEDLAISGLKNIVKPEIYPGIIDLHNLIRVMTQNTLILIKIEEIIDLHQFVMQRLTELECYCLSHLKMKQYVTQIWKAGKTHFETYYCFDYQLRDLAQIYPFVIEWVLKRDDIKLDFDKDTYKMTTLMISRLIHSFVEIGYKDVDFVKFYKTCRHKYQCSCTKKPARYLDLNKLVSVLSAGGVIGRGGLSNLYAYLEKGIQEIDGRWSIWLPDRCKKIPSKTFSKGIVESSFINGHVYYLQDIALVSQVVCLYILEEKPDISY